MAPLLHQLHATVSKIWNDASAIHTSACDACRMRCQSKAPCSQWFLWDTLAFLSDITLTKCTTDLTAVAMGECSSRWDVPFDKTPFFLSKPGAHSEDYQYVIWHMDVWLKYLMCFFLPMCVVYVFTWLSVKVLSPSLILHAWALPDLSSQWYA